MRPVRIWRARIERRHHRTFCRFVHKQAAFGLEAKPKAFIDSACWPSDPPVQESAAQQKGGVP